MNAGDLPLIRPLDESPAHRISMNVIDDLPVLPAAADLSVVKTLLIQ